MKTRLRTSSAEGRPPGELGQHSLGNNCPSPAQILDFQTKLHRWRLSQTLYRLVAWSSLKHGGVHPLYHPQEHLPRLTFVLELPHTPLSCNLLSPAQALLCTQGCLCLGTCTPSPAALVPHTCEGCGDSK